MTVNPEMNKINEPINPEIFEKKIRTWEYVDHL
jgi:hypothetical protein